MDTSANLPQHRDAPFALPGEAVAPELERRPRISARRVALVVSKETHRSRSPRPIHRLAELRRIAS
ncbi:hypothetical protein [Amycolatopsis sp. SID8362]|uniref:hypothetical protein n=1 Tax=Amycolatopsis sp. SID8362 TaxID=2690346 RepID=UPI00136A727F|nr:hypothetical protein [Amycolatopsis sp. SID8362]NED46836.1 hypothetical protein [Amycolatopsis sp. SID8362]